MKLSKKQQEMKDEGDIAPELNNPGRTQLVDIEHQRLLYRNRLRNRESLSYSQ